MAKSILSTRIIARNPQASVQPDFLRVFGLSDFLVESGFGAASLQHACDLFDVDITAARAALDRIDFSAALRS